MRRSQVLVAVGSFLFVASFVWYVRNASSSRPSTWKESGSQSIPPLKKDLSLVFDFGMSHGGDSLFYASLGHRVVGVEASVPICELNSWLMAPLLADGRLVIDCTAIDDKRGTTSFFVNKVVQEWSSFSYKLGCCKTKTECGDEYCDEITVNVDTCRAVVEKHARSAPLLIKVDIQGKDPECVASLAELPPALMPRFMIVHMSGTLDQLVAMGFTHFKLVNNGAIQKQTPVWDESTPGEQAWNQNARRPVQWSGPFGDEALDLITGRVWRSTAAMNAALEAGDYLKPMKEEASNWVDLHACRERCYEGITLPIV